MSERIGFSTKSEVLNNRFEMMEIPYDLLNEYLSKKYKDQYYNQEEK